MKNCISLIVLLVAFFATSYAQSPFSIINSSNRAGVAQISPGNASIGSNVQYDFNSDIPLEDNFAFTANMLYSLPTQGSVNFPIMGNVSLPFSGDLSNIEVGLFPWAVVSETSTLSLIAYGGVEYVMFPQGELDDSRQDFNFSAGLEAAFWNNDGLPITLSVSPKYSFRNLELDNLFLFELTGILPITNGMGFMAEAYIPVEKGSKTVISAGIIVNNPTGL